MSDIKRKLPSITNSIFYQKLRDVQKRPDKTCFVYIVPHNYWIEFENIVELNPNYVTFSYTGTMDDETYLFEETVRIEAIKSVKIGIPLPDTENDAKSILDNLYKINMEAGENAITNQED